MEQNKSTSSAGKQTTERDTSKSSKSGITSIFRNPSELYQPQSESSGVFTKRYNLIKYK